MPARKNVKVTQFIDDEAEDNIEYDEEEVEQPNTPSTKRGRSKTTPPSAPKKAGKKSPAGIGKPGKKKPLLTEEAANRVLVIRKPVARVELGTQTSFKKFDELVKSDTALNTIIVAAKGEDPQTPFTILFKELGFFIELDHYLPKANQFGNNELLFKSETSEGPALLEFLQRADTKLAHSIIDALGTEAGLLLKQNLLLPNSEYPKLKFADQCVVKSDVPLTDSEEDVPSLELMNELAGVDGSSRKLLHSKLLIKLRTYQMPVEVKEGEPKKYQFGFSAKIQGMRIMSIKEREVVEVPKFNLEDMMDEL